SIVDACAVPLERCARCQLCEDRRRWRHWSCQSHASRAARRAVAELAAGRDANVDRRARSNARRVKACAGAAAGDGTGRGGPGVAHVAIVLTTGYARSREVDRFTRIDRL